MQRLQASYGLTYIVISHDLSVVKYLADRIPAMYLGRLVELGPAQKIYDKPAHPYTAGLLEAIPIPNPEVARSKQRTVAVRGELPSPANPLSGCRFRMRCPRAKDIAPRRCRRCGGSVTSTWPPAITRCNFRSPTARRQRERPSARIRRAGHRLREGVVSADGRISDRRSSAGSSRRRRTSFRTGRRWSPTTTPSCSRKPR